MPTLTRRILLTKFVPETVTLKNGVKQEGVNLTADLLADPTELPVQGCVNFTVYNMGTAKAFLLKNAVVIPPGQSWTPPKSTDKPMNHNLSLKFEGDFDVSRNVADLNTNASTN